MKGKYSCTARRKNAVINMKQDHRISFLLKTAILSAAALLLFLLPGCGRKAALDPTVWAEEVKSGETDKEPAIFFSGNTVAKPGDVVVVVGEYLDQFTTATVGGKTVELIQPAHNNLKFEIPADLPESVFEVILSGDSIRRGLLVNKPKVVWLQGDEGEFATPGGWLRVNGECLSIDGTGCYFEITGENGSTKRLEATDVKDAFSVEVQLPKNLAHGTYTLRYSNGYALSEPVELRIDAPVRDSWPTDVFNILDFGATTYDDNDNSDALRAALAAAEANGGGIIYFPRGFYQMSKGDFILPEKTVIRGEGMNLVSLHWGTNEGSGWDYITLPTAIFWSKGNCALEDLTITGALMPTILDAHSLRSPVDEYDVHFNNVYVTNCRIYANRHAGNDGYPKGQEKPDGPISNEENSYVSNNSMFKLTCQNFQLTDCELEWDAMILGCNVQFNRKYVENILMRNNLILRASFHTTYRGGIIEDNTWRGGTRGDFVFGINGENVYFARNDMVEGADPGDREIMCSDWHSIGTYHGPVTFHDDIHLTFPEENTSLANTKTPQDSYFNPRPGVMIVNGTGTGQYRYITERDGLDVTIESPFEVWDETSEFAVTWIKSHWYVIDNYFAYTGDFSFYVTQMDSVVANNDSYFIDGYFDQGVEIYGSYQTDWYITYENNYMHGCVYQHTFNARESRMGVLINAPTTTMIGRIYRRNHFADMAQLQIVCYEQNAAFGFLLEDNLFEEGITRALFFISDGTTPKETLVIGNQFVNCETTITYPADQSGLLVIE